jgi:hypothetical protein
MDAHFGQLAAVPSLRFHAIWAVSQRPRAAFETAASAKALAPVLDVAESKALNFGAGDMLVRRLLRSPGSKWRIRALMRRGRRVLLSCSVGVCR